MAEILKGSAVAAALNARSTAKVEELKREGVSPTLAILRVGERADDISYEKGAMKRCAAAGVEVKNVTFPADVGQAELMAVLDGLNKDESVHGVLILRPLPSQLDEKAVCRALAPSKDVDGITSGSLAGVFTGSGEGYPPCTAEACMEILEHYGIECSGKRAAVIGRSLVVGRPVAMMLMARNSTVTICHTRTADIPSITREADIVIVAAGHAETIDGEYFRPGQAVIDVGINWSEEKGKLCGDVCFEEAEPIVSAITPVPGGVGSVTTAVLVSHVVDAAAKTI
ncbi:MAG: bifunctional 5,10-methylenetetrahydrofolate dehydrogenase/5,10-methenyltetrahydrofolate cyclohydrolase [Clostridiales bacterium]|nr:bifunctional 5,10-methylenetetrahydrofolate dehydrogenase/5,10-methenyltetrahydrofolate cyclohydrolase [Clostridiales bacterium]